MSSANPILRVTYLELLEKPPASAGRAGPEQIQLENLTLQDYLTLYRRVGESLRWDQRLQMPEQDLAALLSGGSVKIHVLRDAQGDALGFCEFDHSDFPQVELKNFGLIPQARGRGLGPWLLSVALQEEWELSPTRIWLHTDTWDHPSAIDVYQRAGFRVYAVREEAAGSL
jgi:GNAT superfamily N-acetyltransferase